MTSLAASVSWADVATRTVRDGWKFRQGRSEIWYPATVPGTVHTDLIANEIIGDPFFRLNERGVQWVDKEDWMYETTLVATAAETSSSNQELVFYGLDTYADVYLNGKSILNANNMHRTWRVDVKGLLKAGDNKLEVYFHSPIKIDLPKCDKYSYGFNTGPDQSQNGGIFDKLVSIFARKAGYHYGWDWGPRLVTSGIWRDIVLETWNDTRIDDVQLIQNKVTTAEASLSSVVEVRADAAVNDLLESQFKNMYFKCLPEVVAEYGSGIAYRPSSPFAFEDGPSDGVNGDAHYWGVWHGRDSIGHYNVERARFFSEYGFQSFPEFESVKLYAPQKRDWNINSEVMMAHQRAGSYANNLIRDYMDKEFRTPDNFEHFLYVGMILQGDAIKTAMEAHRRDMPYCMGTLYWQHNDCWPVASWAARDYYGRWKAQQYFARQAYRDILVSPIVKDDVLRVSLISDRRTDAKGRFTITALTLDGKKLAQVNRNVTAKALTSQVIFSSALGKLLKGSKREDVVFTVRFETAGAEPYTNIGYSCRQKLMHYTRPNYSVDIEPAEGGYEVTVGSDVFARGVFLSLEGIDNFFSDNYFDILPGEKRKIHVRTSIGSDEMRRQLKILSLGDTF